MIRNLNGIFIYSVSDFLNKGCGEVWGEGRVFYCSLGHNDAIYWHPEVLKVYLGGLQYALGDFDVPSK